MSREEAKEYVDAVVETLADWGVNLHDRGQHTSAQRPDRKGKEVTKEQQQAVRRHFVSMSLDHDTLKKLQRDLVRSPSMLSETFQRIQALAMIAVEMGNRRDATLFKAAATVIAQISEINERVTKEELARKRVQ